MTIDIWINFGSLIFAFGSFLFTWRQWQNIKRKIGMINESGKALEILPTWYTKRMMPIDIGNGVLAADYWPFGLLTIDGRTLIVTEISSLSDDGKWRDVKLAAKNAFSIEVTDNYIFAACDRTKALVQVSNIVAAMELASS